MALVEVLDSNSYRIKRIGGSCDMRHHLERLGFVPGEKVTIVNRVNGGIIVNVKSSRIAIDSNLAANILV